MKKIFLLGLTFIIIAGIYTLYDANVFKTFGQDSFSCEKIGAIQGPEDIDKIDNTLYISSSFHKPRFNKVDGTIYKLKDKQLTKLKIDKQVSPHGINIFSYNDQNYLSMVNHLKYEDTIELFLIKNDELIHQKTIKDNLLYNANDLYWINQTQFFVSIDHSNQSDFTKLFENILRYPGGYILFYDGNKFHQVLKNIIFANGLQVQNNILYIASMTNKKILTYDITNPFKPAPLNPIKLPGFPDNLHIEKDKLWISSHAKILDLKKHSENQNAISSSMVHIYDIKSQTLKQKLFHNGKALSGISIAVPSENGYILGNIYQKQLYQCQN